MAFKRFEANNLISFQEALDQGLTELENQGFNGAEGEPNVSIVIRQSEMIDQNTGNKLVDAIIYIDAQLPEIANDLNTRQP